MLRQHKNQQCRFPEKSGNFQSDLRQNYGYRGGFKEFWFDTSGTKDRNLHENRMSEKRPHWLPIFLETTTTSTKKTLDAPGEGAVYFQGREKWNLRLFQSQMEPHFYYNLILPAALYNPILRFRIIRYQPTLLRVCGGYLPRN